MKKDPTSGFAFCNVVKPWMLESIFFFLLLWQESARLSFRTKHKILPVPAPLQNYYYYHAGDFVNGYIIAYLVDGLINLLFIKEKSFYTVIGMHVTRKVNALLASLCSINIIVIFELLPSASTTSDLNDIPAGALGALLYLGVRLFALNRLGKKEKKNEMNKINKISQ